MILHDLVGGRQTGPDKAGKPNLTFCCGWVKEGDAGRGGCHCLGHPCSHRGGCPPRAEIVQIQGKEWLPGSWSINTHGRRAAGGSTTQPALFPGQIKEEALQGGHPGGPGGTSAFGRDATFGD